MTYQYITEISSRTSYPRSGDMSVSTLPPRHANLDFYANDCLLLGEPSNYPYVYVLQIFRNP